MYRLSVDIPVHTKKRQLVIEKYWYTGYYVLCEWVVTRPFHTSLFTEPFYVAAKTVPF